MADQRQCHHHHHQILQHHLRTRLGDHCNFMRRRPVITRINLLFRAQSGVMMTRFVAYGAELSIKNYTLTDVIFQVGLGCRIPFACSITIDTDI